MVYTPLEATTRHKSSQQLVNILLLTKYKQKLAKIPVQQNTRKKEQVTITKVHAYLLFSTLPENVSCRTSDHQVRNSSPSYRQMQTVTFNCFSYRRKGSRTRMMALPGRERSLTISSAVWIQYTNVSDEHWPTAKTALNRTDPINAYV